METYTDEYIKKLVKQHQSKLEYFRNKYHNVQKNNPEFMEKNRERSRHYYKNNRVSKQQYYDSNREFINAKSNYKYYLKRNKVDIFKNKHKDKYDLLVQRNYITE